MSRPALGPALAEVDAVVVATPPSTHVAVALAAIEAGKHVLVEKPLAPTTAGVRLLQAAATAAGVVLMVGHTFEYNPAVRKLLGVAGRQDDAEARLAALGPAGALAGPESTEFLLTRCLSIAGGTTQILLNQVAERVLNLPKDQK